MQKKKKNYFLNMDGIKWFLEINLGQDNKLQKIK